MIYIFGEAHSNPESVLFIQEQIKKIRPLTIVHEMLGVNKFIRSQVGNELAKCSSPRAVCQIGLNDDVFKLAASLGASLIGCDLSQREFGNLKDKPLIEVFAAREARMLATLLSVSRRIEDIVMVVGDTHLRTVETPELGPISPIQQAIKSGLVRAKVTRAPVAMREIA